MAKFNVDVLSKSTSPQEIRRIFQRINSQVIQKLGDMAKQDADDITFTGKITYATETVTSTPFTVGDTNYIIFVDTDTIGANATVNLPAGVDGRTVIIYNIGTQGYTATVVGNGSEEVCLETLYNFEDWQYTYDTALGWR